MTEVTWEDAKLVFPIYEQRALTQHTCFCKCGCRAADVEPVKQWGVIVPGLCHTCSRSRRQYLHERATDAAHMWIDPMSVATRTRRAIARLISPDKRAEAESYVRAVGEHGGVLLEKMHARVAAGKPLTDAQVEAALRSRDADKRSASKTIRNAFSEQIRRGTNVDLTRVLITKAVPDGSYAVKGDDGAWVLLEVSRPKEGMLRGFVVVKACVDGVLTKYGVQYPQPAHKTPGMIGQNYVQAYRGHMPHLVAAIVANPTKAASNYKQLMEAA